MIETKNWDVHLGYTLATLRIRYKWILEPSIFFVFCVCVCVTRISVEVIRFNGSLPPAAVRPLTKPIYMPVYSHMCIFVRTITQAIA